MPLARRLAGELRPEWRNHCVQYKVPPRCRSHAQPTPPHARCGAPCTNGVQASGAHGGAGLEQELQRKAEALVGETNEEEEFVFRNHLECDIERTNDFFLVKVQQVRSFHRVARSFNVSSVKMLPHASVDALESPRPRGPPPVPPSFATRRRSPRGALQVPKPSTLNQVQANFDAIALAVEAIAQVLRRSPAAGLMRRGTTNA